MSFWGPLRTLTVILPFAAYACGGKTDMADTPCEPGATMPCPTSCPGESVCAADGSGWSACACGYGGAGYGGSGYGGAGYGGGGYGGGGYGGGGYGGGGYGGGYGGSSYGGSGAVGPCNGQCPSYMLGGLIEMPACCTTPDVCGGYIDTAVGSLISLSEGCYPTNQPGTYDPSCPSHDFVNPLDGTPMSYLGCCRPNGTCGIDVDLASAQGPYLGCSQSGSGITQTCASPDQCSPCVQTSCNSEVSMCLSDPSCASILFCTQNCSDSACVQKCMFTDPAGMPGFMTILDCAKQKCSPECNGLTG